MTKETSKTLAIKTSRKLIQTQKYAEACQVLQKLLEDDPNDEDALELLGLTSFFQQKLELARDCFERLSQLNPSHSKAWVNLGAILNRMREYKKATETLRRALAHKKSQPSMKYRNAELALAKYERSRQDLLSRLWALSLALRA
jgi:Flp pilus assembly protein TadD